MKRKQDYALATADGAVSKHRVILSEAKNLSRKVSKTFKRKILRHFVPQDDKTVNVLRQPHLYAPGIGDNLLVKDHYGLGSRNH